MSKEQKMARCKVRTSLHVNAAPSSVWSGASLNSSVMSQSIPRACLRVPREALAMDTTVPHTCVSVPVSPSTGKECSCHGPVCKAALPRLRFCYQNAMPSPTSTPWTMLSPRPGTPWPPGSLALASVLPAQLKSPRGSA